MFPFTLHQLRLLKAVATEKNFTKAARKLYISQPSLSKQIKLLEKNLGVSIINREEKTNFLTQNGKLFLNYAERILALCEESCRALIDTKKGERGTLTIGISSHLEIYLFSKIITFFAQIQPSVTLNIRIYTRQKLIAKLQTQVIDFAVLDEGIISNEKPNFVCEPFLYDRISLISSKFHLLKKVKKNSVPFLSCNILTTRFQKRLYLEKLLMRNKIIVNQSNNIIEFDSIEDVKTAVQLGLGIGFVSTVSIINEVNFEKFKGLKTINSQVIQKLYIARSKLYKESEICKSFSSVLLRINSQS